MEIDNGIIFNSFNQKVQFKRFYTFSIQVFFFIKFII